MPGLAAILTRENSNKYASDIIAMSQVMRHESFYRVDMCDDCSDFFAGCRVHINVLNKEPQPIFNKDKTVFVMMDGELRLPASVRSRITALKTDSDAEILLHLYEEQDESFVNELDGRFLALIHDTRSKKTLIVNDCFGLYRAFYLFQNGVFVIASELKGLLKYSGYSRLLNVEKLGEYFLYDAILDDQTFFKDIYRLPAGSMWTYQNGELSKKQYYDLSKLDAQTDESEQDFAEHAAEMFGKIVPEEVRGDDVGISVTGGWDNRAIVAVMSATGCTAPCYSWGGAYRESLDVKLARKIVKHLGQRLQVLRLGKDFFENFDEYARRTIYISDGGVDVYKSHELYFNKAVRQIAPIRVTGAYGTEVAARNPYFLKAHKIDSRILSEKFVSDHGNLDSHLHKFESAGSFINGLRWLFTSGNFAIERSQVELRWPYMNKALVELLFSSPQSYLDNSSIQKYIARKYSKGIAGIPSDKGAYIKSDSVTKNISLGLWAAYNKLLSNLDNAHVHPDIPHFFTRMDPFMRYSGLGRLILGHRQLIAYRVWVKYVLRDFFKSILLDERTMARGYYDPTFLKTMAQDHFGNRANYHREIGKIVSLEIWHRLFVD